MRMLDSLVYYQKVKNRNVTKLLPFLRDYGALNHLCVTRKFSSEQIDIIIESGINRLTCGIPYELYKTQKLTTEQIDRALDNETMNIYILLCNQKLTSRQIDKVLDRYLLPLDTDPQVREFIEYQMDNITEEQIKRIKVLFPNLYNRL